MKLGISFFDTHTIAADAALAEELRFDYVAVGEHLFFHGPTPNALIALAAAAGNTRRIRLLSTVALAPLYPAALFAKQVSTLDCVSGGRLDIGLGVGGEYPPEFAAVNVDPATRFQRLEETLAVMRALFTGAPTNFTGRFTTLDGVSLNPIPIQQPSPPIWLAGRKAAGIRRAGRYADVWIPYMITPDRFASSLADVRAAAGDAGREPDAVVGSAMLWTCVDEDRDWARQEGIAKVSDAYQQDFAPLADRYLVLGTPDEAVARLREYEQAGADRVLLAIATKKSNERYRVIRTIAEHVAPALHHIG
jgi:probable F420-dependent oxidoreductase